MDCTDEDLHQSIIQNAIDRGKDTLSNIDASLSNKEIHQMSPPTFTNQSSSSSSGLSQDEIKEESTITTNEKNSSIVGPTLQPIEQVGGIASHKHEVLGFHKYILKPLRLTTCHSHKDGMKDMTKSHRGLREVAFYEALHAAASTPSSSDIEASSHKRILLSRLGYFDYMILLSAYYTGDSVVKSSLQSRSKVESTFIKEVKDLRKLSAFTSSYFGVVMLDRDHQETDIHHLLLQNLTTPFHKSNIIDIKIGTQTYEPSAPLSKQIREVAKYPQQSEIGFRIVGMKVYFPSANGGGGEYKCLDKSFGIKLKTKNDVIQGLMTFFQCDNNHIITPYIKHVLSSVIKELTLLKTWFDEENSTLAFYASSILIVYDAEDNTKTSQNDQICQQDPIVKMIDFAHVCRCSRGDKGYLKGITTLLTILYEIYDTMNYSNTTPSYPSTTA